MVDLRAASEELQTLIVLSQEAVMRSELKRSDREETAFSCPDKVSLKT